MIELRMWVRYDNHWITLPLAICANDISSVRKIFNPSGKQQGSVITTKNGKEYEVKEDLKDILSAIKRERME